MNQNDKVGIMLDCCYGDLTTAIERVFELFDLDKNIIETKLDDGSVAQSDYDTVLENVIGVVLGEIESAKNRIKKEV